jgi:hypothetical protein
MRWLAGAFGVALLALAALLLSRDHARAVRADATTGHGAALPDVPEAAAGPDAGAGAGTSPISPLGAAKPETIRVEVVSSPGGLPVAGARVEVRATDAEARVTAAAITDGRGVASLTASRAGGTLLVVSCRGFVPAHYWLYEDERDTPTILLQPGLAVDGLVTFADTGQPAAGAEVLVFWPSSVDLHLRSDAVGRFEIPGIEANDPVTVIARVAGYWPAQAKYAADPASPHMQIVIGRGGRCEGRVTDEAGAVWRTPR